tara:strand:+ start:4438 stop:4980 length:543 start_codon:yes stop_codon:yes gene_type:complete
MAKVWSYESKQNDPLSKLVKKEGREIVFTKPEMAIDLITNHTNILDGDVVCEPGKGDGAFYDNLPNNCEKIYCEINEGIDYLEDDRKCDITLSNPPFVPRKLFWKFQQKAMENTRREIYWLINIGSLNVFTPKRLNEMKEKGWFINSFHIVADKRWYGRYAWVKITKTDNGVFSWEKKSY